jgi:hypothetical protein
VTFYDGATAFGTGSLNGSGQVTLSISSLTAGPHSITASYAGNSNFASSTSAALTETVNKANTTTAISTQSPNPSVAGQPVAVNFTVTPVAPGSGTPTGNVTVSDGLGDACTTTPAAGGCSLVFATAGAKTVKANYAGDSNFNASTSAGGHTQRNRLLHFGQPHFSDNQGRTEDKLQANVDTAEWFWWNHFAFLHWTAIGFNV